MRVAVDIDNVTLDWHSTWIDEYCLWFDRWLETDKLNTWDSPVEATHFDTWAEFWHWFQAAGLWDKMPYVPGAPGALLELQRLRIPFLFCTSRPDHGHAASVKLARAWNTTVDFASDRSKQLTKASVWVDDSPHVAEAMASAGKRLILLDRPWNEGAPAWKVARDWRDVLDALKEEM